jgi:CelD/BcsL family acetyltransferase involved in cellulose biosynthesis
VKTSTIAPALRFESNTTDDELHALVPAWAALLERSDTNEPMLSPDWLLPWWEVYGRDSGRRLQVGAWYNGDRLVGLALLQSRPYRYRGIVPFRRLEFVGADVDENDGVCSEYLNLIAERGAENAVTAAFVAALGAGEMGSWDELILGALDETQPIVAELQSALAKTGWAMHKETVTTAPYIPLPPTWDEYVKSLGRHKRVVVKSQKDFDQWAQGRDRMHCATDADSLAEGMQILHALHAERWGEDGQAGAFHAPRFRRFHEMVAPRLRARGALDLRWLRVADEPVCCLYSIRWNNKVYFYQSGRRMQLPSEVRVGHVLHAAAIKDAIAAGMREYDFLGGEAQYKSQLSLASRPIVQLRIVRAKFRERLRIAAERCVDFVRPVRSWLARRRER